MRFPIVHHEVRSGAATVALGLACVATYAYQLALPPMAEVVFEDTWGLTPAYLATAPSGREALTLFTSLFLHTGFAHLMANLFVLALVGPRVERALGSATFAGFYLVSGALAGIARAMSAPGVIVPLLGAEGAVAGTALACLFGLLTERAAMRPHAPGLPSIQSGEMAS